MFRTWAGMSTPIVDLLLTKGVPLHTKSFHLPYFFAFVIMPWLLTGCPLDDSSGGGFNDDEVDAEEMCEDLAYWLCGHGEPCLNDIPVDECTDAVIRDLRCWEAVGVKASYDVCGREIVDWDCHESDAPLSCQDAIIYRGDPEDPGDTDVDTTDTADSIDSDNPTASSDAKSKCEAIYTNLCEHMALCASDDMGDLSLFTTIRNECIRASEPMFHCQDAIAVSDGYDECVLAVVSVDCNVGETTVSECENVIVYD